jgi:hypothetical protein
VEPGVQRRRLRRAASEVGIRTAGRERGEHREADRAADRVVVLTSSESSSSVWPYGRAMIVDAWTAGLSGVRRRPGTP